MSVFDRLEQRKSEVEDPRLELIVDEAIDNFDSIAREISEPTLKHGTDTVNYDDIITEGLVPGEQNSAVTGESSEFEEVSFSTSFPVALRYAELTEACDYLGESDLPEIGSVGSPMVVEVPASEVDQVRVGRKNMMDVEDYIGTDNPLTLSALLDHVQGDRDGDFLLNLGECTMAYRAVEGDDGAEKIVQTVLGGEYCSPEVAVENGLFDQVPVSEFEGEFLQEVNAPYAELNSGTNIFVPKENVSEYSEKASDLGFEGDVNSIEARALVHEERLREEYRENGTLEYSHPSDTDLPVNVAGSLGSVPYNESADVIDISRLRARPVYQNGSQV